MEVSHIVLKSGTGKTLTQVVRKAIRNWSNEFLSTFPLKSIETDAFSEGLDKIKFA